MVGSGSGIKHPGSATLCSVLPRGQNFGRKTQKGPNKIVWGLTRGSPPFYITNAGGEPRVKLGIWRPEMLKLFKCMASSYLVFAFVSGLFRNKSVCFGCFETDPKHRNKPKK
jgi:hypothetical protein